MGNNISKIDYSKCDYGSVWQSNHMEVHLVYGFYRCFDPFTGGRTEALMMYGYNKKTQIPEKILPLTIELEGKHMWLLRYTYKSRAEAILDGEIENGVDQYGQFWTDVGPEIHDRGYIR